jgi:beta-lactamase superfamily II metal-dependent hydrolase
MTSALFPAVGIQLDLCRWFLKAWYGVFLGLSLLPTAWTAPPRQARNSLQIYFVDVEGGQATLFVTPGGQSLLIDTGWPGNNGRDADRIVAAARKAAIERIDFVLLTHFHQDHAGGITQLAAKIPIGTVIDHGENREHTDAATEQTWQDYQKFLAKGDVKRLIVKPGDVLPLQDVEAEVISADGALIEKPLPGAGDTNTSCKSSDQRPADQTENLRSLGTMIIFGKLRILDLGDLTWDKEMELMCPSNRLGTIDIYIVSHHGWSQSNSPALLNGIAPRVAIMDNGATKGGSPSSWDIIKKSPRFQDFWQLHFSNEGGAAHNVADPFIANLPGPDAGNYLKLTARKDGSFEVFNSRTQRSKHYETSR